MNIFKTNQHKPNEMFDETMQRGIKRKFNNDYCSPRKRWKATKFLNIRNVNSSKPMVLIDGSWRFVQFYANG
jgi:hypothetical protein